METPQFRQPTKEEADALTKDLQEVLKKHNANMSVRAAIELLIEEIPSPFVIKEDGNDTIKTETPKID